ncbi:MAG: phosphodiester glycosidase family protein [Nitrospiraceae bacterium]
MATSLCLIESRQAWAALMLLVLLHLSWPTFTMATGVSDPEWDRVAFGLNATLWRPASTCPDIPPLLMVQIDPERFRFSIYQYHDAGLAAPLTIQDWQRHTGAYVLFNAGLFREDYSYLGLLLKEGRPLGSKRHHSWQGVFAAEPKEPTQRKARVLDLAFDSVLDDLFPYREAAQSLMLLDRTGKPRVRQTGKRAYQTIVAEDRAGSILVMRSTEPVALYGLAECLRDALPTITQAMAMDGGSSSDILASPEVLGAAGERGRQSDWRSLIDGSMTNHIALPVVIGILPRTAPRPTSQAILHSSAPAR